MLVKQSGLMNVTSESKDLMNVKICRSKILYDYLTITKDDVICQEPKNKVTTNLNVVNDVVHPKIFHKVFTIKVDGILAYYFVRELQISPAYRKSFIRTAGSLSNRSTQLISIQLIEANKQIIDYAWNDRTTHIAWERLELDHCLSWLSTLGGAFSALGDYFSNCALMAGKISFHQLKLAIRLGDPTVASRCKLFLSLSLIQRGYFRLAKKIIYEEYHSAKNATVTDARLVKMCQGIWAKLKYERGRI
ncbi:uncharacterized protein CBL_12968 [Carabus blaptoides fortunei]